MWYNDRMKNRNLFIAAAALVSLGFALMVFRIDFADPASSSYLTKIVFFYVSLVIAALLFLAILAYNALAEMASQNVRKYDRVELILLDMRDGTKRFYMEKRRSFRMNTDMLARFTDKGTEDDFVHIGNISRHGLQVSTTRVLVAGETIGLHIYLPLFPKPIPVKIRIAWVRPTSQAKEGKKVFEVGVEFKDITVGDRGKVDETIKALKRSHKK